MALPRWEVVVGGREVWRSINDRSPTQPLSPDAAHQFPRHLYSGMYRMGAEPSSGSPHHINSESPVIDYQDLIAGF